MKAIVATERVLFSQRPLVVALPAMGAMARIMLFSVQASVNENIAPKLNPVEKIRFWSMQSCGAEAIHHRVAESDVLAVRVPPPEARCPGSPDPRARRGSPGRCSRVESPK